MALTAGTRLGPYEILSPLGAGGMGEVYRARDTRLGRDVAVKVLPTSFSKDPERLHRFEQEARATSALNHPNILAMYDVGQSDDSPYVVSELLEGETLGERLRSGALGQRKAIEYAVQIAHGLAAAHEKGIVHRDLKPENLFITREDHVKILDFGLAKLTRPEDSSGLGTEAGTVSISTEPGKVMGTVGYMSPEQVRGQAADHRTDIFSFGTILYEMLAGQRAFQRDTTAETMTAILKEEPSELVSLGKNIAPSLVRVVDHCLEKRPELRFQSAKDLAFALEALSGSESATAIPSMVRPRRRAWLPWTAVAVACAAAVLALFLLRRGPAPVERMQFAIPVFSEVSHLALSADGRMLTYVAYDDTSGENMLFVQRVGSPSASELPGTEGAYYPFWSPDDAWVAFFANGKLKKVPASGGPPQVLANSTFGRGGAWGSHGVIIYTPDTGGPLWRVNADGTHPVALTGALMTANENSHRWPLFLPDGDHFLFWAGNFQPGNEDSSTGLYVSSLAATQKILLVPTRSSGGYANGQVFHLDDKLELIALPVNAVAAKVLGEPHVVADAVDFRPATYYASFSVAGNGTIVYNSSGSSALSALTWYDRTGKELGQVGEPGVLANPTISPDGKRTTVDITDLKANNVDVWLEDFDRKTSSRFTFDPAEEVAGVWSRDGNILAYRSVTTAGGEIRLKKATGLEQNKLLFPLNSEDDIIPNSWSTDDRQILCSLQPAEGGSDLVLIDASSGKETPFLMSKASETNGQISPDGKWVAYASNESGDWEIYVTTFPNAEGKWQVSRGGGTEPRWRGDGKEIYYIDPKGILTAVPASTGGTFSAGTPSPLFPIRGRAPISSTDLFTYDVARDGNRFLVNRYLKPDHVQSLTVILNATAEIKK